MQKFLETLHVIAAVFLIGPLVIAPMTGLRAIRHHDVAAVKGAGKQTFLYGLLSLVVFVLGVAIVPFGEDRYDFGSAWITISMTLYVIAIVLVLAAVAPSLNSAAKLLATEGVAPTVPIPDHTPDAPTVTEPAGLAVDVQTKLDAARGRVAITSGIVALLMIVIVIFMVTKPFS